MSRGAVAGNRPVSTRREAMVPPMMGRISQGGYTGMGGFGGSMPPRYIPPAPPGTPQNPVGMAAGGYIPQGDFGQSPYNMGMNQMNPYAPVPSYMGNTPANMPNQAMSGGGTAGYMGGGAIGYSNGGVPEQAGLASLPLPRHYGL